jgi:phage tail sheath protein FI
MTDYTYPGVYIQEVSSGPGPITGVSTSNLGLIGFSTKGPVNEPIISTSFPEWASKFGTFTADSISAHEAYAFFVNGGQRLYFVRVTADDADDAYWDFPASVEDEQVDNTVQPTGIYDLQLDYAPVLSSGFSLTFSNAGTPAEVNVFVSDDDGVLTLDATASGGSASGGTGTIDLSTGEIHVELTDPSQFTGTTDYILATYNYVIFRFQMAWPGAAGNFYRVRIIQGSDDYLTQATASWSRFTVIVDEDVNQDALNRSWATVETWADLVFDDSTSPSYVATVINADGSGSDLIEVVDYGNGINPPTLQGTAVTDESVTATQRPQGSTSTPPVAYDGATKAWEYTLANAPFEMTLGMDFQMADGLVSFTGTATADNAVLTDSTADFGTTNGLVGKIVVNITGGASAIITANDTTSITGVLTATPVAWTTGDIYAVIEPVVKIGTATADAGGEESIVSPGSTSVPAAIVPGSVTIDMTLTGAGAVHIIDDGDGNLWDGVAGSCATIDYTTGQITGITGTPANTLTLQDVTAWSSDTAVASSDITFGCIYATAIALEDDANGNMSISDTQATGYPQKFSLNSVGVNTVSYTTGVVNLTWAISGNPGAGPAGAYIQTASYYMNPATSVSSVLAGGTDGTAVSSTDIIDASLAIDQAGIYAFGKVDALMQLVAADFQTDSTVGAALVDYAELMKDKFVLLTVPHGLTYQEAVNWKKFTLNKMSSYAALYYPHVKVLDPVSGVNLDIPCGGHVAGVYARTDNDNNVGEAPAGMGKGNLAWSTGLELDLTPEQVGIVYKTDKINALVQWPHTGRVVWGARTLDASGGEFPYIQMRRTLMFVEKSVFNSTHVHLFRNNGPALWNRIRNQVSSFLLGQHQAGVFAGTTPSESYFVICDRTNNPQNTVDQGIVFCDVGVATNKPAEFLVFRFSQKVLSSEG